MRRIEEPIGAPSAAAGSRGQAVTEFALIAPILLFVLLVAVDFGRIFFTHIQLTNAAREGVAAALANPTDIVGITARVTKEKNTQSQVGEGSATVTVVCANASTGATIPCSTAMSAAGIGAHVTVTVAETFGFFTPLIGNVFNNSFTLRASATGTVLGATAMAGAGGGGGGRSPGPTPAPTAACAVNASSFKTMGNGKNQGNVEFNGDSTGSPTNRPWSFGDGGIATARSAFHLYSMAATWTFTLVATHGACGSSVSQLVIST